MKRNAARLASCAQPHGSSTPMMQALRMGSNSNQCTALLQARKPLCSVDCTCFHLVDVTSLMLFGHHMAELWPSKECNCIEQRRRRQANTELRSVCTQYMPACIRWSAPTHGTYSIATTTLDCRPCYRWGTSQPALAYARRAAGPVFVCVYTPPWLQSIAFHA